jgi:hypothetical protein
MFPLSCQDRPIRDLHWTSQKQWNVVKKCDIYRIKSRDVTKKTQQQLLNMNVWSGAVTDPTAVVWLRNKCFRSLSEGVAHISVSVMGISCLVSVTCFSNRLELFPVHINTVGCSQWPCGLRRESWPVGCWDRGFESRSRHEWLSASFCVVLSCVGRDLATGWSLVQGVLPCV